MSKSPESSISLQLSFWLKFRPKFWILFFWTNRILLEPHLNVSEPFFILRQPTDQLWSKLTFSDFHLPSAPVVQRSGYPAHVRNKRNWRLANRLKQVHPLLLIGLVTYRCWLTGVLRIDKNRAAWVKITVIEINFKKFDTFCQFKRNLIDSFNWKTRQKSD